MVVVVAGGGAAYSSNYGIRLDINSSYPVFYHGYSLRLLCIFAMENLCNV